MSESVVMPSGTTAECLAHFLSTHKWAPAQEFLAELANVNKGTIRRWKNGSLPTGELLLKLRVLLDTYGYRVKEFNSLALLPKQLGRMIALDLMSLEGVRKELGYKSVDGVYDLVLRGHAPMPDKAYRLKQLTEGAIEELNELTIELQSKLKQLPLETVPMVSVDPRPQLRTSGISTSKQPPALVQPDERCSASAEPPPDTVVHVLILQLQATGALAQLVDSSADAERMRYGIRAAVGREPLKALVGILNGIIEQ